MYDVIGAERTFLLSENLGKGPQAGSDVWNDGPSLAGPLDHQYLDLGTREENLGENRSAKPIWNASDEIRLG